MKCKCGYEGLAEIGNFPDERFDGKYLDNPKMNIPYICPKCKFNKNIIHINQIDSVRSALRNPHGRIITFSKMDLCPDLISYCICDSKGYGCASTISLIEYNGLIDEFKGILRLQLFQTNEEKKQ